MKTLVIITAALVIGFAALAATNDVRTGVWTADIKERRVQLSIFPGRSETLDRRWNYNGNIIGFHVPLAKLTGLTGADGDTKFTYRASAGTIDFDGHFSAAQGAGHFRFTPSDEFVRDMAQLGYTDFKEDSLLIYTVHDLSPAVVRELKTMGYQPSRRELDDVAIFDINPEAIRELARLGYPNLTLRELRDLRIGNITAKRIEAYRAAGYPDLTAHQLSEMGIMGVTPDYIKEMNDIGVHDLHKIIELRTTGAGAILLKKKTR